MERFANSPTGRQKYPLSDCFYWSYQLGSRGRNRKVSHTCLRALGTAAFGAENGPHIRSKRRELSHKSEPSAERLVIPFASFRNEALYRSWWYLVTGAVDDVRADRELGPCACEDRACLARHRVMAIDDLMRHDDVWWRQPFELRLGMSTSSKVRLQIGQQDKHGHSGRSGAPSVSLICSTLPMRHAWLSRRSAELASGLPNENWLV